MGDTQPEEPNQPSLTTLPLLIRAGLVISDLPVRVWRSAPTERQPDGLLHTEAACEVAVRRTSWGTPSAPAPVTVTAGELAGTIDGRGRGLCSCACRDIHVTGDDTRTAFFTATRADLDALTWLHSDVVPAPTSPVLSASRTAHLLRKHVPRTPHRVLGQLVEQRREELRTTNARARSTAKYRQELDARIVRGTRTWEHVQATGEVDELDQTLLELTADLDPTGPEAAGYAWIQPGGNPDQTGESTWAWVTDMWPATMPDDAMGWIGLMRYGSVARIPTAVLYTLPEWSFTVLCLDHGYTVEAVRASIELARHATGVAALIPAAQAALD